MLNKKWTQIISRVIIGLLIFSILVIFALLALTVYINYRPLKLLVSKHSDKAASAEMSELEILDSAFLAADEKLYDQKQQLTNFLLGDLVEYGNTEEMFSQPRDKRTEDYITGRFG